MPCIVRCKVRWKNKSFYFFFFFFHQVEFTRETEEEGVKTVKHNKRILFQRMAPYPQRKVITFNRYNDDFAFDINYGDLSFLSQDDLRLESCLL